MSPEFGELVLEILVLYGKHEDSDRQASFLDRTVVTAADRLSAIRTVQSCSDDVRSCDRELQKVVNLINSATTAYASECEKAGVALSSSVTSAVPAGLRATALDAALGEESNLAMLYADAHSAVLTARRKVRPL